MRKHPARQRTGLNGVWQFALDPCEKGIPEGWALRRFGDTIRVPGTWLSQDKYLPEGERQYTRGGVNGFRVDGKYIYEKPFYFGTAWYARDLEIPQTGAPQRVFLVFEGITPRSEFFLDGIPVGVHEDGPWLPARIELTGAGAGKHRLAVRVTQRLARLQGLCKSMIMGIWKDVYLEITSAAYLSEVFASGDPHTGKVTIEAEVDGACPEDARCRMAVGDAAAEAGIRDGKATASLTLDSWTAWSEHTPQLYTASVRLYAGDTVLDEMTERFGLREFSTAEHRILINGKPVFLRGCGQGGRMKRDDFTPRLERGEIGEYIGKARAYGYNWMRWHSGFWPEEILDVADETGMMMSQELFLTLWSDREEHDLTVRQWTKLIRRYRNHPCIWVWSMGNEMGSQDPAYAAIVREMYETAKALCPQVLVSATDGVELSDANKPYNDVNMVGPGINATVGASLDMGPVCRLDLCACGKPLVVHELGYIESYPDVDLAKNETAQWMHPLGHWMLKVAKEKGIPEATLRKWQENSEKLCTLGYYTGIENVRRVDGVSGYNQWIFADPAEELSGYIREDLSDKAGMNAEKALRVNGETVVLMTPLEDRYTLEDGENYRVMLHVSHHGTEEAAGVLDWELEDSGGRTLDSGSEPYRVGPVHTAQIGPVVLRNPKRGFSDTLTLELSSSVSGKTVRNVYKLWSVFLDKPQALPRAVYQLDGVIGFAEERVCHRYPFVRTVTELQVWDLPSDAVLLVNTMLPSVVDFMKRGGRVLYIPLYYLHGNPVFPSLPSKWGNLPSWAGFDDNGGSVIEEHPLLEGIPHEGWADLQFFDLLSGTRNRNSAPYWNNIPRAIDLEAFPRKPRAIIRSLAYAGKLNDRAHLIELRVGKGAMIAATMRVYEDLGTHPECKRFMDNALRYIASDGFCPETALTEEEFDALYREQGIIMD